MNELLQPQQITLHSIHL